MQSSHAAAAVSSVFDEDNLIADAGLVPVVRIAEQAGRGFPPKCGHRLLCGLSHLNGLLFVVDRAGVAEGRVPAGGVVSRDPPEHRQPGLSRSVPALAALQ